MAESYNNAGILYDVQGNAEKAEHYYKKAIGIFEELAEENPDRFSAYLANSYFYYALFIDDNQYLDRAYQIAKHYPDNRYCKQIIDNVENSY